MKSSIYHSLFFSLLVSFQTWGQNPVWIFEGGPITIDGVISPNEWQGATNIPFVQSNGDTTYILIQHDEQSLSIVFYGNLESGQSVFPEVLLDVNHSRSSAWQSDDWWFHVSATDCDYQGAYGNYDSCSFTRPDWEAVPNFVPGSSITDIVEMKIPFSKINYNYAAGDTIGLAFVLTNTFSVVNTWPPLADRMKPSTWTDAVLFAQLNVPEEMNQQLDLYPVPSTGDINILSSQIVGPVRIRVLALDGRELINTKLNLRAGESNLFPTNLAPGNYLFLLESEKDIFRRQIKIE